MSFENSGNTKAGGLLDARVEILEAPRKLTGKEKSNRRLARSHESGQAGQTIVRPVSCAWIGLWRGVWQHRRDVLLSLGDLDRAIKGGKLNFGPPVVHRAEKALGHSDARCWHIVAVRNDRRLIDDISIKGSGSDVKRVAA